MNTHYNASLILFIVGILIVVVSHLWLLKQHTYTKQGMDNHSYTNLVAAVLIIIAWYMGRCEKSLT